MALQKHPPCIMSCSFHIKHSVSELTRPAHLRYEVPNHAPRGLQSETSHESNVREPGITVHQSKRSRRHHGMIKTPTRKTEACSNILRLKVWQFLQHLLWCQSIGKQVQHIGYTDAHPADPGAASALFRINGDA